MNQERQMNLWLGDSRFWITLLVIFNCAVLVVQNYGIPAQFFDTCGSRADCPMGGCWDFWRIMGAAAFGFIPAAVVYWTMYHVMYAAYFWLGFLTVIGSTIWYVVQGLWMIGGFTDCDATTWCYGCTMLLSDVPKDPAFVFNFVCVWVLAFVNFGYCWIIGFLRNKTEFGFFWWISNEQKINDRVPYIPTPFAYGVADSPTGQTTIEYNYRRWFRTARFIATILCMIHLSAYIVMLWDFGNLLFDTCSYRAFTWQYFRLFSNVIGIVSVFTGYWYLWHLIYELWHIITMVVCGIVGGWHLFTWMWIMTRDVPNCDTVSYCVGCPLIAGQQDWALTLFIWMLGVCWVCSFLYIVVVWFFWSKIGEVMNMEALASPNYPGMSPNVPLVINQSIGSGLGQRKPAGHLQPYNPYILPHLTGVAPMGHEMVIGSEFDDKSN
jgi:hypothetical protein